MSLIYVVCIFLVLLQYAGARLETLQQSEEATKAALDQLHRRLQFENMAERQNQQRRRKKKGGKG